MSIMSVEELKSVTDPERVVEQIINPETDGARYPYFHRLRELTPLHRTEHPALRGFHLVSSYELGSQVLNKTGNSSAVLDYMHVGNKGDYYRMVRNWMNHRDSLAEHDRVRAHFSPHFMPKEVNRYRPMVETLINELLDRHEAQGGMEMVGDFAFPLPATVIARVLGLEDGDVLALQQIVERYVESCDQGHALDDDTERFRDRMTTDLQDLFRGYLVKRREDPRDDLISELAREQAASGNITDAEILDNFVFALLAGHTTTTDMIGNITVALSRHPEQREQLRREPARIPGAITELMRYDSSIAIGVRYAYEPVELGGQTLPAGSQFIVVFHAAHHDPAQFRNPDSLDIDRVFDRQPFPFGMGRYFCLGAVLARMEMELTLKALLARFPRLEVTGLQWMGTLLTHGPKKLQVSW